MCTVMAVLMCILHKGVCVSECNLKKRCGRPVSTTGQSPVTTTIQVALMPFGLKASLRSHSAKVPFF